MAEQPEQAEQAHTIGQEVASDRRRPVERSKVVSDLRRRATPSSRPAPLPEPSRPLIGRGSPRSANVLPRIGEKRAPGPGTTLTNVTARPGTPNLGGRSDKRSPATRHRRQREA
jgi:hypothetical protein